MKIALINDISGFGNCSLTAAISVLSAMGHETFPLPTAALSNQTAYDSYALYDLTEISEDFLREWDKTGEKIDCVYSGFSPSKNTPKLCAELAKKHAATFVLDPVLGDDGKFYKCFDENFLPFYKKAAKQADYVTPNLTELCFLTDANYKDVVASNDVINSVEKLIDLLGAKNTVVTGIFKNGYLYNVCKFTKKTFITKTKALQKSYSGTGDVFASVFTGSLLNGNSPEKSVKKASKFVYACIKYSVKNGCDSQHGTLYQKFLKTL